MAKLDAIVEIERIAYNIQEAAAELGIGRVQLGGLVRIGAVPHMKLGTRVLIGKRALEQWPTEPMYFGREPRYV